VRGAAIFYNRGEEKEKKPKKKIFFIRFGKHLQSDLFFPLCVFPQGTPPMY
jgi:hypothetical protein